MNLKALEDALHYMSMSQLRKCCEILILPSSGNKAALINRIIFFVRTGEIKQETIIPEISRDRNYPEQK